MIAIIDYNTGNIQSLQNAIQRLGQKSIVSRDPSVITRADKVILPGVGHAGTAMRQLQQYGLVQCIQELEQPVFGICLGMQIMCKHSEEGNTTGLGIFDAEVKRFPDTEKVPHMGWNNLTHLDAPEFKNIRPEQDLYFVHSYYATLCKDTSAQCEYILPFSAALRRNNFFATQFHPEKSAYTGEQILKNFLSI